MMDFNTRVRLAVYRHFAGSGKPPIAAAVADAVGASPNEVSEAYRQLRRARSQRLDRRTLGTGDGGGFTADVDRLKELAARLDRLFR